MPLTQERFNEVFKRLRSLLLSQHPNWENHLRALERFAAERVVSVPPAVAPDLDLSRLSDPQRTAFKTRMRNALGTAEAQALLDELMP